MTNVVQLVCIAGSSADLVKDLHVVTEAVHDPRKIERQSGEVSL